VRYHRLKVLRRLPHPDRGFTQGLIAEGGTVWESTGLYGQSTIRRYQLGEDRVNAAVAVPPEMFGEGICRVGVHLWQLTWRERVALRWDPLSLTLKKEKKVRQKKGEGKKIRDKQEQKEE